uniref:SCP domain-containing protein n=1 Tax=Strongyloides venezuelensis TaxID=75913 RepID=A0A0K0FIX6_STRVS
MYLIPYWIILTEKGSLFEYNDDVYTSMFEMSTKILLEKKIRNPGDAYLYNVGFKKGYQITKTYVKTCECLTSFLNPNIKSTSCDIKHRNPQRNLYRCKKEFFRSFDAALDYALHIIAILNLIHLIVDHLFHQEISGFAHTKNHYLKELNQYRQILGKPPLTMNAKLNVMAKTCAEKLAYRNKLIAGMKGDYDEVIAFAKHGYGFYLIRILFDDYFFTKHNFKSKSIKYKTSFKRLLSCKQRIVGFGLSRNGYGTFICIKFTSDFW